MKNKVYANANGTVMYRLTKSQRTGRFLQQQIFFNREGV